MTRYKDTIESFRRHAEKTGNPQMIEVAAIWTIIEEDPTRADLHAAIQTHPLGLHSTEWIMKENYKTRLWVAQNSLDNMKTVGSAQEIRNAEERVRQIELTNPDRIRKISTTLQ